MLSIQAFSPSDVSSASKSTSKSNPTTTPNLTSKPLCTPNLLPCRIHHDGPVNASCRHWDPQIGQDGNPTAYFRGRKLKGKEVRVPDGYRGLVVGRKGVEGEKREVEDRWRCEYGNDAEGGEQEGGEEDEDEEEVAILEELATFEEMVVWDHEKVVEDGDGIVKGLEEWIRFAEVMHASGDSKGTTELVRR